MTSKTLAYADRAPLLVDFFVHGIPVRQGSKNVNRATGSMYETSSALLKPWRQEIIGCARVEMDGQPPIERPCKVTLTFAFPRPLAHYRSGSNWKTLRESAPRHHAQVPDADKLIRAALDALTMGHIWRDDKQAYEIVATRVWCDRWDGTPGMGVVVVEADTL